MRVTRLGLVVFPVADLPSSSGGGVGTATVAELQAPSTIDYLSGLGLEAGGGKGAPWGPVPVNSWNPGAGGLGHHSQASLATVNTRLDFCRSGGVGVE